MERWYVETRKHLMEWAAGNAMQNHRPGCKSRPLTNAAWQKENFVGGAGRRLPTTVEEEAAMLVSRHGLVWDDVRSVMST